MEDLNKIERQIEIFCAFVIDFEQLKETVTAMILSEEDDEIERVLRIQEIITHYITGANSVDDILSQFSNVEVNNRINKLINYIRLVLLKDKQTGYHDILKNYVAFKELIATRPRKHILSGIEEIDDYEMVTADPSVPISKADLSFLNWIAKLSLSNTKEINEANKEFKNISFRTKLNDLYCTKAYYFEQVFSNIDVKIQRKLLDIISNHQKNYSASDEEKEAYKSLTDINILSDIDNLANKTSSNVSDHQAFEAFTKILRRNKNHKLIKNVLKENIIMTAMFNTNTKSIGNYYGLRKLFVSSQYPYNKVVIQRYMQLMEKDDDGMNQILYILNQDKEFNTSYEAYLKSSRTKVFREFAEESIEKIKKDIVSSEMEQNIVILLDGFISRDMYTFDILPQIDVLEWLDEVYYYIVRNKLMDKNDMIQSKLQKFLEIRIQNELDSRQNIFHVKKHSIIYSITPGDLWYRIHQLIQKYRITHLKKIYLKYNEISIYVFDIGHKIEHLDENFDHSKLKFLPKSDVLIICTNVDRLPFDRYMYGLFNRIIRGVFKESIQIQIKSITGSAFRKKVILGIDKTEEPVIRKTLFEFITLYILMNMNENMFINVYKSRIEAIMKELYQSSVTFKDIQEFVNVDYIPQVIQIYNHKAIINRLMTKYSRISVQTDTKIVIDHAHKFFEIVHEVPDEEKPK